MTYPTPVFLITTLTTRQEMVLGNRKENIQSQTDWDSNPRPTAHSSETPGKFLTVLDLNYPLDNRILS